MFDDSRWQVDLAEDAAHSKKRVPLVFPAPHQTLSSHLERIETTHGCWRASVPDSWRDQVYVAPSMF